jgi:hypothetical protein
MITTLALALAAILLAVAVWSAWRSTREKDAGRWVLAFVSTGAGVIILAAEGAIPAIGAGVLAFLAFAIAGGLSYARWAGPDRDDSVHYGWKASARGTLAEALGSGRAGFGRTRDDVRGAWRRIFARTGGRDRGEDAVPLAAVAEYAASRAIPSVMADPVLGPPVEPGEIAAAGVPVPAQYAALAQYIGGFEPEDDQALRMFMEGHAAGTVVLADAWHHFADHCLNGVGLSPAYVAGILEAGDSAGEHASLLAQVHKRFGVVYAAVKEWIAAHGPLPHKAREFLSGED